MSIAEIATPFFQNCINRNSVARRQKKRDDKTGYKQNFQL